MKEHNRLAFGLYKLRRAPEMINNHYKKNGSFITNQQSIHHLASKEYLQCDPIEIKEGVIEVFEDQNQDVGECWNLLYNN